MREETPGEPPTFRRIRFIEVDHETAAGEIQATDAAGDPLGDSSLWSSTWLQLQEHASQPADATTGDEVVLALSFGAFVCWLYKVRARGAEVRFWVA
jgi:hypothetical protein